MYPQTHVYTHTHTYQLINNNNLKSTLVLRDRPSCIYFLYILFNFSPHKLRPPTIFAFFFHNDCLVSGRRCRACPGQALADEVYYGSSQTQLQRSNFITHSGLASLLALAGDFGRCEDWSCRLVQSGGYLVDVVQTNHGEDEARG